VCEPGLLLDIDQNSVPDASETLIVNGTFTADIEGWLQSQRNNTQFEGVLFEFDTADATDLQCSGSMLLISTENAADNFAEQCVTASAGVYAAISQALLVGNSGGGRQSSLEATGVDPSFVTLELAAFDVSNCQGTSLANEVTRLEMIPGDSWQTLRTRLTAPAPTQSLRLRVNVVADDPEGLQVYRNRTARWDNLLLRPD
jgi:hypothetical protein